MHRFCLECREEIFNPLCPICLAGEIKVWMRNKPQIVKRGIKEELNKILVFAKFNDYPSCVVCTKNKVFMCPYCFTERIYNNLKQARIQKKILMDFLEAFNFDFEHNGYSKDMEKFGML